MIRRYPITGLAEGWYFRQEEVSAGCFVVEGSDVYGRRISLQGVVDPDAAMAECIQSAQAMNQSRPGIGEPSVPPNGDLATQLGISGVQDGPPSVS
jgi:hypothetical protein